MFDREVFVFGIRMISAVGDGCHLLYVKNSICRFLVFSEFYFRVYRYFVFEIKINRAWSMHFL